MTDRVLRVTDRVLPQGWAWTTLAEFGAAGLFRDGDWVESKDQDPSGSNRLVQLADIGIGTFKDKSSRWMNDEAFDRLRCTALQQDDVLIARMPDPLGRACLYPNLPYRAATVVDVAVLRPDPAVVYPRWLMWIINTGSVSSKILEFATGTTRRRISRKNLAKIEIPLPPLPEQRRIVEVLEDHLSRLDAAERTLSSISRRAELLTEKLLDDTILGVAKNQTHTSGPPTNLKGRHDRFRYQDLPTLPEGWTWQLATDLCASINSGSTPKAELMQQDHGEVPFLKIYNIDPAGHINFTKNPTFVSRQTHCGQLKRSVALPGDVVTNIVGPPLGKSAIVPATFPEWNTNQAIVALRAGDTIQPDWLAACLRSPYIVNLLKSTARATAGQFNIALSTCRELPLPVPPLPVQSELLAELENAAESLRHASSVQLTAQQRSAALCRSILRAAFNGELVDQDPTDEPADVALAKLRVESTARPTRGRRRTVAAP